MAVLQQKTGHVFGFSPPFFYAKPNKYLFTDVVKHKQFVDLSFSNITVHSNTSQLIQPTRGFGKPSSFLNFVIKINI